MSENLASLEPKHGSGSDTRILVEQIKTLYESIASLVLINLVVSAALLFAFWDLVAHSWLLSWMAGLLLMLCVRVAVYLQFKRRFDASKLRQYQAFLILGSASAGIIWGTGGLIMFVPGQLDYQLLILLSLLAMAGGSAFSLSIYLPAYFAFVPAMLAPITIHLFLTGDSIHIALGALTLIFLIAQTLFNIKINRSLTSTMALRFENLELIDQLQVQKAEAERANMAKSSFLATASHDLRQPLYALTLFTSALEERITAADHRKIIHQIKRSAEALQSLFDALLDISKLDAGTVDIHKTDFSLTAILETLAHEFEPQATEKNLTISWPLESFDVHSDPILLQQILRNYISNAIRYTKTGGITVHCMPHHNCVKIGVRDTGVGIVLDDQNTIFEEYYQLGNPERDRQKGLGLGLAIVQRAADQLGHDIEVTSKPGHGSTFSVTVDKATGTATQMSAATPSSASTSLHSQPLIVVIDDDESVRDGMQQLLSLWGCELVISENQADAIAKLSAYQKPPDGIICDFRLRDNHTGLEAIDAIHIACGPNIPALIVTGDTEKALLIELKSSGHQALHKPVSAAKIRAFLRSLPGQKSRALVRAAPH
ncbi:MAG: hybrid sensor histidine kinase/response regulator [Halioglobus sp.]